MVTKEIIIEIFKKNIKQYIRNNGTTAIKIEGEYFSVLGFFFNHKMDLSSIAGCQVGISAPGEPIKYIYFNTIKEPITNDEYVRLYTIWLDSLTSYDYKLLEDVASKSEINVSRRVLTEKRDSRHKVKF